MRSKRNDEWIFWGILLIPLLWAAAALAQAIEQGDGLSGIVSVFSTLLNDPFSVRWCSHTAGCLLAVLVLYPMAVCWTWLTGTPAQNMAQPNGAAQLI